MKARLTEFVRRVLAFLVSSLNDRTKRLIFVSSLFARLKPISPNDNEVLKKINDVFLLCSRQDSLKLTVHLSKVLWEGKGHIELCGVETKTEIEISERILGQTPTWLRYSQDETIMRRDIALVLKHKERIVPAQGSAELTL